MVYHKLRTKSYVQYTVRVEEDLLEKIRVISYKEDISINEAMNQSLKYAIDAYEKEKE